MQPLSSSAKSSSPKSSSPLRDRYGPVALVTGASDGIGRAFAHRLAAAGFDLVLVARREAVLAEVADELHSRHGIEARILAADLSDAEQVRRIGRETAGLDIGLLVAAAGFGTSGPFVEGDPETELNMLDVNCRALAQMTQLFARRFVERGRGGIVLMSSLLAFQGVPRAANYGATKAYVQTLAVFRRATLALTHFWCRRVDGSRLLPSEILPWPAAFISVRSSRPALSSITSRSERA